VRRGWWRRNLWGLIVVLPLIGGFFALNAQDFYNANFASTPRDPAPVDADGAAVLDDYHVAIDSFESVGEDDPALLDRGVTVAGSVQAWRAVVDFTGPEEMADCTEVDLIDDGARIHPAGPSLLDGIGALSCNADDIGAPSPYQSTFYFLLPAQAQPQALRIIWEPLLPRYIELPVAG
jgi:hypothetical protein